MGLSDVGIFLVEYTDMVIETALIKEDGPAEVYETYRISADNEMLEWIYEYREKIGYLILVNPQVASIEVIKIDKIPRIIKNSPESIYLPTIGFESHKYWGLKPKK